MYLFWTLEIYGSYILRSQEVHYSYLTWDISLPLKMATTQRMRWYPISSIEMMESPQQRPNHPPADPIKDIPDTFQPWWWWQWRWWWRWRWRWRWWWRWWRLRWWWWWWWWSFDLYWTPGGPGPSSGSRGPSGKPAGKEISESMGKKWKRRAGKIFSPWQREDCPRHIWRRPAQAALLHLRLFCLLSTSGCRGCLAHFLEVCSGFLRWYLGNWLYVDVLFKFWSLYLACKNLRMYLQWHCS